MDHNTCLGIVLAGGKSSRMGTNKAQLKRGSLTMLDYSKQLLASTGIQNIIVSGDNYEVPDYYPDMGPLCGIFSVIERYKPKSLMVVPIDLPLLDKESLLLIKQTGELSQKACFYKDNRLPLYLPCNAYTELFFKKAFTPQNKGPSFKQLLQQVPYKELPIKNKLTLLNCNTEKDWQLAQTHLRTTHAS